MNGNRKVIITGAAGFIGFWLTRALARDGVEVIAIDNLNDYYAPAYKLKRLGELGICPTSQQLQGAETVSSKFGNLRFQKLDIADRDGVMQLFEREHPTHVVNLAAQAGVRHSLQKPFDYLHSNIDGFLSLLEAARYHRPEHLVYASSSSVYGANAKIPFAETDSVDKPESLYAATKRSNELMAYVYGRLYGVKATGLRFFTVYGPWGRPDMAPMLFAKAILSGEPIRLYNRGNMKRDFTYISDIVEGVKRVLWQGTKQDANRVYNIGHGSPVNLPDFVSALEGALERRSDRQMLAMQPGDVPLTYADTDALRHDFGYEANTELTKGVARFAEWLRSEAGMDAVRICYGDR